MTIRDSFQAFLDTPASEVAGSIIGFALGFVVMSAILIVGLWLWDRGA